MKSNQYLYNWGICFFFLTIALALFSWIGSIYGIGEVQSLLSAEGVRWMLSHVVGNYVQCPALGVVLLLLIGLGIMSRAGVFDVLKRLCRRDKQLSRKERRSLVLFGFTCLIYVLLVLVTMALPWNLLLSATGSWLNSPFSKGFVYILSLGLGLSGMVYGYTSDAFRRVSDVVEAMSCLVSRYASYFVVLFFVVQFFSSLEYTRMYEWLGVSKEIVHVVFILCSYFPLLLLKREGGK